MGNRHANIDFVFRNGLADYEAVPPSDAWDNISAGIRLRKKYSPLFRYAATVAAVVAIGSVPFLTSLFISENIAPAALTMNQELNPGGTPNEIPSARSNDDNQVFAVSISPVVIPVSSQPESYLSTVDPLLTSPALNINSGLILPANRQADSPLADRWNAPEIAGEVETDGDSGGENSAKKNRLSIGAMMTPSYYSRFSLGASDAGRDLIRSEKGAISYTGGVSLAFEMGKRLSFQTGIYYSSIGQKVTGVNSYSGFMGLGTKGGTEFSVRTANGTVVSGNGDIYLANSPTGSKVISNYLSGEFDPAKEGLSYLSSSLIQNFGYLEIPLVAKYNIVDRRFDLRVIGGLSYNMLLANRAYVLDEGVKYILGKTEGLSPITFSSSVGMGLEYSATDNLSLNLEPTFRYYLTPLGGTPGSSIHPYSFGLLSGIVYKF